MTREELLNTLDALHQELATTTDLDDETRQMLRMLTADIQRRLESTEVPPSDENVTLADRLQESVVQFETRHPQLTTIIERLTDGLAKLGI